MTSTSGMRETGLKKCRPTSRGGSRQLLRELLEHDARRIGRQQRIRLSSCGSSRAYSSRFASRFSKIASMTTSACATPLPSTSLSIARSSCRASLRFGISLREERARTIERRRDVLQFAILQRHSQAARRTPSRNIATHHAGAHDVHVLGGLYRRLAADFSRSCRKNTRTRLREVDVHNSSDIDRASAS